MNFAFTVFIITYLILLAIALFVTSKITKNKNTKIAVFAVWLIAPTWDLFLGYPVYWYLHQYESGVKIYKTINNVEGFYVGEKNKNCEPKGPYSGYRFIDYKEKESGKYYRKYLLETHPFTTEKSATRSRIAKEEINKNSVSTFWLCNSGEHQPLSVLLSLLNLTHQAPLLIKNIHAGQELGEFHDYQWQGSWIMKLLSSSDSEAKGSECTATNNQSTDYFVNSVLKCRHSSYVRLP